MNEPKNKNNVPLVQVRDLLIEFGSGRKKVKAVKGVTFDVNTGETFGLVGESGSGKTTVARAIMGMQPVADGTIYFNGSLARGKKPNLFNLSKALERNLDILIENQITTTQKIDDYLDEYKRIYYKYLDSKFYVMKTKQLKDYDDGVDRRIKEGVNLKNTKIMTSDKENHVKQLSLMVNDSLKRLVKLVRILQKTSQFTNQLGDYIDLDKDLDKTINQYLKNLKSKILEIKDYENQVYFALKDTRKVRKDVKNGEYTSVKKFFDKLGTDLEIMVENHKNISKIVEPIRNQIYLLEALFSPAKVRKKFVTNLQKTLNSLKQDPETNAEQIEQYEKVLQLLSLKNINDAIDESALFAKPTRMDKKNLKKEMQMIFQDPASSLNDRMSVEEIIGEGLVNFPQIYQNNEVLQEYLDWYNFDKDDNEKITAQNATNKQLKNFLILQQLESVGLLPEHLSRYPHEFSGGQRQRIGIARSLIMRPKFIVADEPISALDVSIRAQVLNLLKKFQKESNLTYIFIAHDLSVVRHIADRIAVIYRGDIVELADAEELFNNPLHPYTKSLLTAIPLADPEQEAKKVHFIYNPEEEHPDYLSDFPVWQEVSPGHFVYANKREFAKYEEELNSQSNGLTKKSVDKIESATPTVKKGRGRPKKVVVESERTSTSTIKKGRGRPRKNSVENKTKSSTTSKKRGRPRKNPIEQTISVSVVKKGRGRPKKVVVESESTTLTVKRGPGRPKKVVIETETNSTTIKRGRGRPPKVKKGQ